MPRAPLTETEEARTRERLCDAALALYREHGQEAVTFRRLAETLGTSHTRPYRYFEGKEALMAELRLRCFRSFADVIRDSDPGGRDPAARLRSIHAGIMRYVRDHPAEYRLMFSLRQPPLDDYPALLTARRAAFDYLVDVVRQAVAQSRIAGDARTIMHVAWGAVHGVLSLHAADQLVHGRSLEQLTTPILYTVLGPLFEDADEGGAHIRRVAG